jgi:Skp family chaperone for outer membrane proteins
MRLVLLAALVCVVIAPAVVAAEAAQPALNVGVVDWNKMREGFKDYQDALNALKQFVDEREARLQKEASLSMVTAAEKKEYDDLSAVPARTDEQTRRLADLEKTSRDRENEVAALQTAASPTPEQQKRLEELRAIAEPRKKFMDEFHASLRKEVQDKNDELMKPLEERIRKTLEEISRQERLAVVLRKEDVLSGGVDVTSKLLARLNRK